MEFIISCISVSIIAILSAMSARFDIGKIPWTELIRNSKYFGSAKEYLTWMVLWVVFSNVLALIISIMLMLVFEFIDYKSHLSISSNSLVTIPLVTVILYLVVVQKTHHSIQEASIHIPKEYLYSDDKEQKEFRIVEKPKYRPNNIKLLNTLPYLSPKGLSKIYSYFYNSTGSIIDGCGLLLYHRFGKDILFSYNEYCKIVNKEFYEKNIKQYLVHINANDKKNFGYVFAILMFRMYGYHGAENRLKKFVILAANKMADADAEERKSIRKLLKNPLNVKYEHCGINYRGKLIDYSHQGLYLSTRRAIDLTKPITIWLSSNQKIVGEARHRYPKAHGQEVAFGVGVKASGVIHWNKITKLLG